MKSDAYLRTFSEFFKHMNLLIFYTIASVLGLAILVWLIIIQGKQR